MPSPVGHALTGLLVAALVAPRASSRCAGSAGASPEHGAWRALAAAGGLGVAASLAPDLDFVPGFLVGDPGRFHHGPSHSLGGALAAGLAAAALTRLLAPRSAALASLGAARVGLLAGLAWTLHVLLDALAADTSVPYGVMLFWPVSDRYVISPWSLFLDIQRRQETAASFFATLVAWHNVKAVLLEALLIGPPGLLALRLRHPDAWRRIARADRLARPTRPG